MWVIAAVLCPPIPEGLSRTLRALTLTPRSSGDTGTAGTGQQAPASGPSAGTHPDPAQPGAQQDRARTVLLLMSMPGRSFSLADVEEAVRVSTDLPSALRFLSHSCPICQEQVSFSQVRLAPPLSSVPAPGP